MAAKPWSLQYEKYSRRQIFFLVLSVGWEENGVVEKNKYRSLKLLKTDLSAKSDREPVENLGHRQKADSKAKSTEAAKAGDEVQPGHLRQPLVLWE